MSYLINDELIWISNPKCASTSIETALKNSKLKIEPYILPPLLHSDKHVHITLNNSINRFGKHDTICITRNWFSKWFSALSFIWEHIETDSRLHPILEWNHVDNDFIYRTFDDNYINSLYSHDIYQINDCFNKLLKNKHSSSTTDEDDSFNNKKGLLLTLVSEKYWLSNQRCTYEFDINELNKFGDFIENKFGEKLIIETHNKSIYRPNKIIINDELKQWVWDNFEKRFQKPYKLV